MRATTNSDRSERTGARATPARLLVAALSLGAVRIAAQEPDRTPHP